MFLFFILLLSCQEKKKNYAKEDTVLIENKTQKESVLSQEKLTIYTSPREIKYHVTQYKNTKNIINSEISLICNGELWRIPFQNNWSVTWEYNTLNGDIFIFTLNSITDI